MPKMPTGQASGVRNLRGASGARLRIASMQTQTAMNAGGVPGLARAAGAAGGERKAGGGARGGVRVGGRRAARAGGIGRGRVATRGAVKIVPRGGEPRPLTRA